MKQNNKHIVLIVAFLCITSSIMQVFAQETVVVGQILNATDKTPIPSVNIFFKNTDKGAQSNEEGYFLIRNYGNQTTLVFSALGYKRKEIRVKAGESVGMEVKLTEENTLLQEIFVVPGANPAIEMLKKIRLARKENDASRKPDYNSERTEQNLVLLSKINQRTINRRIFEQLAKGSVSTNDTTLTLPLYMDERMYLYANGEKKNASTNKFSSLEQTEKIILSLLGEIQPSLNFYDNTIAMFGKSLISPLANTGDAYYHYSLTDSIINNNRKEYHIQFRSKNSKSLAFNGQFYVDSATLALTRIRAELPSTANLNYIQGLDISQQFERLGNGLQILSSEQLAVTLNYELLADSLHPKPILFLKRSVVCNTSGNSLNTNENFAQSNYTDSVLNVKMKTLNETPVLRFAKWLADIIITGYVPAGKMDIGKIQQFMRISDIEGLRLTLPIRTNENLWKNICLGGYAGYGFRNNEIKYSASAHFRLPSEKRVQFGASFTDDYRRIDYDYNDIIFRENALITGDEDIGETVFAFRSANKLSNRKEFAATLTTDLNSDIESNVSFRSNRIFSNNALPFFVNNENINQLKQQSLTLFTRFSFGERTYEDHFQRIYINNGKPVIYAIIEGGRYEFGQTNKGNYAKFSGILKQNVRFELGEWNYILEGGYLFGKVPYPILKTPTGSETGGYSIYKFIMMNNMEYASDKYISMHNELSLNGIIMNHVPLIRHLNLRELFSFKVFYGGLNNTHQTIMDFPVGFQAINKPYMEVGVGFSNILRVFTLQSVWRLTDLNKPGVTPWGLRGSIQIGF